MGGCPCGGEGLAPAASAADDEKAQPTDIGAVRFVPQFVLQAHDQRGGKRQYKAYVDKYVPAAMEAIRRREVRAGDESAGCGHVSTDVPRNRTAIEIRHAVVRQSFERARKLRLAQQRPGA